MGGMLYIVEASWLNDMRQKDMALLDFDLSTTRKCTVYKTTLGVPNQYSRWSTWITLFNSQSFKKCSTPCKLSNTLRTRSLGSSQNMVNCYLSRSANKMQFLVHTTSPMTLLVWRTWALLKCKTFAWFNSK
jgi:hypothetical protein